MPPLEGEGRFRRDCLLEPVPKAHGRLGAMGNAIRAGESGQIISRRVVYEAAILRSHEDTMREVEIGPAAVDERGARL